MQNVSKNFQQTTPLVETFFDVYFAFSIIWVVENKFWSCV